MAGGDRIGPGQATVMVAFGCLPLTSPTEDRFGPMVVVAGSALAAALVAPIARLATIRLPIRREVLDTGAHLAGPPC